MRKYKYMMPIIGLILLLSWSNAAVPEGENQPASQGNEVNLSAVAQSLVTGPIHYQMRQEFLDSFERSALAPWETSQYIWGIRDTADAYGPETPAFSGYRYAGVPEQDIAVYLGNNVGELTTPSIDITGWDSLYLSFNYWSSFEGPMTNFDGGILLISPDDGTTWMQLDSLAEGHLNPTYDARLANTGALGTAWAYCYSTDPDWVSVSSQDLVGLGYASPGNTVRFRWTFASDPLAGGEGWFVDDVRIAPTSPPDLQAPSIVHTPLTDTTDTLNNYVITATVTDLGSGVNYDSVMLHYQIEEQPIVSVYMDTIGTGSPDVYEAEIPVQTFHTDIYYRVTAADHAGNEGTTPRYNFEVTNARTIIYDDGQPWYGATVVNPGDGIFVQFSFADVGIDSGLLHQVKFYFDRTGQFDLCVYRTPGDLIDSIAGLTSPGYMWHTVDITHLDIHMRGVEPVVGYIIGTDSLGVLKDATLDYGFRMWDYVNGNWQNGTGGDNMIRLKVIPIDVPGVEDTPGDVPRRFVFRQISHNPTRNHAVLEYQLPTVQKVSLHIYDASGQLIKRLVNSEKQAGTHRVVWNGSDEHGDRVASGVYFVKFETEEYQSTEKLLFVR